jgi:ATP-dependent helicase HepA
MTEAPQKGQRWVSESEPELGVGVVVDVAPGRVFVLFRASSTLRQYATASAPLRRVTFQPGDTIRTFDGTTVPVETVAVRDGLLVYRGGGREVPETDLSDTLTFGKPEERLLAGQVDDPAVFALRLEALQRRQQIRSSPVRGLRGGRMDLIPHQLFIAHEVSGRVLPRVLLADEVGLGKTIEAALILHRLWRSGRAGRILILVPEPLVHQWFVELLRRFALRASIFDEERCAAIAAGDPDGNPFLDDQLVLCALPWLAASPSRTAQAVAAGWDLVVVDEAHHLAWTPGQSSPEYETVAALAALSPGVILLTATPEQLGAEGHFARLRLLDPDRYARFAEFAAARQEYRSAARLAARVLDGKALTAADRKAVRALTDEAADLLSGLAAGQPESRDRLLALLLDRHGPGRVMFRNTRAVIRGFPRRRLHLERLDPAPAVAAERAMDGAPSPRTYRLARDPRVEWLVGFLQKRRSAKVLVIGRTKEKALALEAAIRDRVKLKVALFHEDLTLLQRDRQAAWFAEPDGAQVLICSEIGSEGRNFQFAHHLVLFDLPENPELLEQRIGRLDRIGQTQTIAIHVPAPAGSPMERLARWFHDGLDAFETPLAGGREMLARFGSRLQAVLDGDAEDLEALLADTTAAHRRLTRDLHAGEDRLLQMNSCRPAVAARLVDAIAADDADTALDAFVLRMLDHCGGQVEELAPRTWRAVPAAGTALPEVPAEGLTFTADRARALAREEMAFLTWDHPLVMGLIDLLIGSEQGNCAFATASDGGPPDILLETVYVLEPVAPPALHADRFLPPTPLRVTVNSAGEETDSPEGPLSPAPVFRLLDQARLKHKLLPVLLEKSRTAAESRAAAIRRAAEESARRLLEAEGTRLRDLRRVNPDVRAEEITHLADELAALAARLREAPLRLDAIRLVWRNPV